MYIFLWEGLTFRLSLVKYLVIYVYLNSCVNRTDGCRNLRCKHFLTVSITYQEDCQCFEDFSIANWSGRFFIASKNPQLFSDPQSSSFFQITTPSGECRPIIPDVRAQVANDNEDSAIGHYSQQRMLKNTFWTFTSTFTVLSSGPSTLSQKHFVT